MDKGMDGGRADYLLDMSFRPMYNWKNRRSEQTWSLSH